MAASVRPTDNGWYTILNAATQNLKTGRAAVRTVIVNTTAASLSTVIDSTGTSVTAANTILVIPASTAAGTVFHLDWHCLTGLSINCGGAMTLNVSWDA